MKLCFFDIDGTLVVPLYKDKNGNTVVGFTDEEWFEYCEKSSPEGYKYCKPVMPVIRYARQRKEEGARLFVLSTAQSLGEIESKKHYINENFPGLFEGVLTVDKDSQKIEIMNKMAMDAGVEVKECELVEDTYANILKANDAGFTATHISSLVCDL